jgi:hypothetical protein
VLPIRVSADGNADHTAGAAVGKHHDRFRFERFVRRAVAVGFCSDSLLILPAFATLGQFARCHFLQNILYHICILRYFVTIRRRYSTRVRK